MVPAIIHVVTFTAAQIPTLGPPTQTGSPHEPLLYMASSPPPGDGLAALRLSSDSTREEPAIPQPNGANGHIHDDSEPQEFPQDVDGLKQELEKTRAEKDELATQYRNLLAKLTTMRTTLGNKLREDAVSDQGTQKYTCQAQ